MGVSLPDWTGLLRREYLAEFVASGGAAVKLAVVPTDRMPGVLAAVAREAEEQRERTGGRQDGGVDLIAEKRDSVGTRARLFVQCKDTAHPVGVEVVRSLNGVLPPGDRGTTGVVVGPAGFTPEVRAFAAARQIQLWDAAELDRFERSAG